MPDEKCFIPTLRKNLKTSVTVGGMMGLAIAAAAILICGVMFASEYLESTGFFVVAGNITNEIGSAIVSNHTAVAAVIFIILLAASYRSVTAGNKRDGYSGIVYTMYTVSIYLYIRVLFWIHALVLIGGDTVGTVVHDATGGWAVIISAILLFCTWCGIVFPIVSAIDKCFKRSE